MDYSKKSRKLTDLGISENGRAVYITDARLAGRLIAMGILPGAELQVVRSSPLGDALYIKADGLNMALRREEAACILIEA